MVDTKKLFEDILHPCTVCEAGYGRTNTPCCRERGCPLEDQYDFEDDDDCMKFAKVMLDQAAER